VKEELGRMWNRVVMACSELLFGSLHRGTEEDNKNRQQDINGLVKIQTRHPLSKKEMYYH
jgi:hypothetical protein